MRIFLSLTSLFLATATPAAAQSQDRDVIYKQITEIDMTGLNINATIEGPDGVLINQPTRLKFNPLIKLRKDFDAEMEQSVDEVR